MSTWAIDAYQLVKKFPQRTPINEAKATGNGHKKGAFSFSRFFSRKQPKSWFTAVDGVDLQIAAGEIFGLLGPNGAGKSTTIRMLCTLLEPTSGTARVNGFDIFTQPTQVRQSLGTVLTGERSIYWKLTGRENLEYFAALYHIPSRVARKRIDELLERMEIAERADELVEKYSTGMKQRIALSKALLARPPILLLDEPTLGLDPQAARRVRELIAELKTEGHTILLTTHYMEEADQLSDRIGIIDQGKIIALDTPAGLKQRIEQREVVHMEVSGWHNEIQARLLNLPQVSNLIAKNAGSDSLYTISLQTSNSRAILPDLIQMINQNGTQLVNLNIVRPTLEDVFIHLTGKALRD